MKRNYNQIALICILSIFVFLSFFPLFLMVSISFKSTEQFFKSFWGLSFPLHLTNYVSAWQIVNSYITNSLIITVCTVIGALVLSVLSAYSFSRFKYRYKEILFYLLLALLMVPQLLTLVPLFLEIKNMGLVNNKLGLILPYIAGNQILAILILRAHFESIPQELFEAATIDGAGDAQKIFYILLPLSGAVLGSIAILTTISVWNDFILPMVVMGEKSQWTITLGLFNLQGQYAFTQSYGPMFAGYVLASLPIVILFFIAMKAFISGLTSGAVKM